MNAPISIFSRAWCAALALCTCLPLFGCAPSDGFFLEPSAAPPWPTVQTPLLPCVPYVDGLAEPVVAAPSGQVLIQFSSTLVPIGYVEKLTIKVLRTDRTVDTTAQGPIEIDLGQDASVLDTTRLVDGVATARVVLERPGVFVAQARELLGQTRAGTAEAVAFATQLPVWEMSIAPSDLERIVDNPSERLREQAVIKIDGTEHATMVRLHGGSSKYFPKKSFRFDLAASNGSLPENGAHLVLRAEWNDKSMLRTWLAYELFRNGTWLPTPRSEYVHFRINGEYYGVMNNVQRIDMAFLDEHGLSTTGSLYEADPPHEYAALGNLTPLASKDWYEYIYQDHAGLLGHADLLDFVEGLLQQSSDAVFADRIGDELAVQDYVVYLAMMAVLQNQDHVRKNYFLYRDPQGPDDRWIFLPWDLDLSFGHLWTEENDVLDEEIVTDDDLFVGVRVPERFSFYNQLTTRLHDLVGYREYFLEQTRRIIDVTFVPAFVDARIDNATCRMAPDIVADMRKRASLAEYLQRVDELRQFVSARRSFVRDTQ